jgi:CheY-like chemotaxis protein
MAEYQKEKLTAHTHQVNPETGGTSVVSTFHMDDDSTAEQLAARYAILDDAAWLQLARTNQRRWVANEVRRFEQRKRIAEFKSAGRKVDAQAIAADEKSLDTAQWRHEVEIRTDAKMNGLDGDAVMQQLRQEVTEHTKAA